MALTASRRRMLLGAAAGTLAMPALAQPAARMVIGTGVDPSFGPFFIGVEGGFFQRHGIAAELRTFSSGSAAVPSLISRDTVAVFAAPAAGVLNNRVSADVVFVAHAGTVSDIYDVVGGPGITTLQDLRGKRVGFGFSTATELFLLEVLKTANMTRADLRPVNLQPPEGLVALQRRDVDAVSTFKPWTGRIAGALPGTTVVKGLEWYLLHQHIMMNKGWAMENRATAVRFLAALREIMAFTQANPQEASAMVGRRLRMETAAVVPLLTANTFGLQWSDESMRLMKREVEAQIGFGNVQAPFDYSRLIWPDLLRELDASLVTFSALPVS